MKRAALIAGLLFPMWLISAASVPDGDTLDGFTDSSAKMEREWETKFRALPSPENIRSYNQRLSAYPHNVGTAYDKDNAEWILGKFQSWGWDAHIETFDVLYPTPKARALELIAPVQFTASLAETAVPGDPTSSQSDQQLPTYNAYSADGDVTAPLVYVNYGVPDDYEQLDRMGISVKGAIVIARYGAAWRGIKPKVAGEHGAIGCIIYSDPADDGYTQGDVFPDGAFRPKQGVQRGSVMDTQYPGDPLTPGVGATKSAKRLALKDAITIQKIPVLPIGYGDALPFLSALKGPVAPAKWRGALPITYHVGPGPAQVHLKMESNWDLKTIYDVIAKIPGTTDAGEWIIRGNHHDAWVNGSDDPVSGQSALLEEARSLGELVKEGWRPKRTIIYCAWDGEEPGLLGSTEWVEEHAEELHEHAAVYINSDSNSRGFLSAGGSPSLEHFINDVARDITDPEKNISVWRRAFLRHIERAQSEHDRNDIRSHADIRIGALGSGSDYAPFLDHAGIATLDLGFGGESGGGVYHSIYDDFYWYSHFGDPQFVYGRALSQTVGTAVMRLADADLLPFQFTSAAEAIGRYVKEVKDLLQAEQDSAKERNREIDEGVFTATSDPNKMYVPPSAEEIPPALNFAPLDVGAAALDKSAKDYAQALTLATANGGEALGHASLSALNQKLMLAEHAYLYQAGLPGRPWFQHEIFAPGAYTGYGVKTLPAVREMIEQKNWPEAEKGIAIVAVVLQDEAACIEVAAQELEKAVAQKQ
ncbi:MAG: transferrin receptor-like dimerization domain-containing protein [Candidatus Acidiferrales bacterium]